jgi:hypothetical protein
LLIVLICDIITPSIFHFFYLINVGKFQLVRYAYVSDLSEQFLKYLKPKISFERKLFLKGLKVYVIDM